MKSPVCVLAAAMILWGAEPASSGEPPWPQFQSGVSGPAGSASFGGPVRPASHEGQRLSNEELFRLLFETDQRAAVAAGYDEHVPSPPMHPHPDPGPWHAGAAMACGTAGCTACASDCPPFWQHRTGVFGEFLYLHPRNADVHFATPTDGLGINAVPVGRALMADPGYDPGLRVGGRLALSEKSSLGVAYTWYGSSVTNSGALPGGTGFLFPQLVHPNTVDVGNHDYLAARTRYDIDFQLFDVTGSFLIWGDCWTRINAVAGVRYARLDQDLRASYSILGTQTVATSIDFDGFGPRLGLEAERLVGRRFFVYGNAFANFLAGEFESRFVQESVFAPGFPEAITGFDDDRIVSLLELELGIGWQSRCGRLSARTGYYVAAWFNTVTTSDFVKAVHADDFNDATGTLTFDGLTARLELNY